MALGVLAATAGTSSGEAAHASKATAVHMAWFALGPNSFDDAEVAGGKQVVARAGNGGSVTYFPEPDAPHQLRDVEDAITTGRYNVFVINSIDQVGILPAVRKAAAAGIKIVADNDPIGPNQGVVGPQEPGVVGSALVPPAQQAFDTTRAIILACRGVASCDVGFLNITGTTPFDLAYKTELAKVSAAHPNIHVVDTQATGLVQATALTVTRTMLLAHPTLSVIASVGDQAAAGAYQAVSSAGKTKSVKIIGAGASVAGVAAVRSGKWFATALLLPRTEGAAAATMAVQAVEGKAVRPNAVNVLATTKYPVFMTKSNLSRFTGFTAQWAS